MRQIVRKLVTTDYQILGFFDGKTEEMGHITLEGESNMDKARKAMIKEFPKQNCFIGETVTKEETYRLDADKFLELAVKDEETGENNTTAE